MKDSVDTTTVYYFVRALVQHSDTKPSLSCLYSSLATTLAHHPDCDIEVILDMINYLKRKENLS